MPDYVACPGCGAPLKISDDVCGACRRPLTNNEREAARDDILRRVEARRQLPRRIARALALAALAAVLYVRRGPALALLTSLRADIVLQYKEAGQPKKSDKPLSPLARQFVEALNSRGGAVSSPASESAPAPAPAPPPPPKPVVAHPPEPPKSTRPLNESKRVYGVVYDIETRFPIAGASVSFTGTNGAHYQVVTGPDGLYMLDVLNACMHAEYTVEVTAAKYREGQIEDTDPPYFEKTPEQRRAALEQLSPSDLAEFPLRCPASARVVELNVVLVPKES